MDKARNATDLQNVQRDDKAIVQGMQVVTEDKDKNREELIAELKDLRQRMANSQATTPLSGSGTTCTECNKSLANNDLKYKALFEESQDGIALADPQTGIILDCNQSFLDIVGWERSDLIGKPQKVIHPPQENEHPTTIEFQRHHNNMAGKVVEALIITPSGLTKDVEIKGRNIEMDGMSIAYGIFRDITKRKRMKEALKKSEEKFRALADTSPLAIYMSVDIKQVGEYMNPTFTRLFGYTLDDVPSIDHWWPLAYPNESYRNQIAEEWQEKVKKAVETQTEIEPMEVVVTCRDGSTKNISWGFIAIGEQNWACGFDQTERKQTEKALQKSEEKYRGFFNSINAGVVAHAPDTTVIDFNKMSLQLLGLSEHQMLGKSAIDPQWRFLHEDETVMALEDYPITLTLRTKSNIVGYILGIVRPDVEEITWAVCNTHQIKDSNGKLEYVLVSFFDITGRKHAEEDRRTLEAQMLHSQKLESLGVLAGGIAHDFNNILAAIIGFSDLALLDAESGSEMEQNLNEVIKASNRAALLVKQILSFSQRTQTERKALSLQPIILEALKLIRGIIPVTIEIKEEMSEKCYFVEADATQIHQVIMNLCTNAYHAMQDQGGILKISLKETELDSTSVAKYKNLQVGRYAHLTISDTGCGMNQKTMARIFEPYFTTKDKSKGSGLGLATVYGIIRNYRGDIFVSSEIDRGTVFNIFLPICEKKSLAKNKTSVVPEDLKGNERILFVDDEETLTRVAAKMLKPLGYKVETYTSSLDAQKAFLSNPQAYDIIITDFAMPRMTGLDMATNILAIRPDIPIILCTGYSDSIDATKAKAAGIISFMNKPIATHGLAKNIRQVLNKPI